MCLMCAVVFYVTETMLFRVSTIDYVKAEL